MDNKNVDTGALIAKYQHKMKEKRKIWEPYIPSSDIKPPNRIHQDIEIDSLVPFFDHPFHPYDDSRFNDMVESIKENGVISPIIVRPHGKDGKYEILSGHNRVNAAKKAGLNVIPAVVYEKLSDDNAKLIVAESNLIQRSFADMPHSERAAAISILYDAMRKKPGYRSDLLEKADETTCSPMANRPRTMEKLGNQYGMSKDTIARYLRISKLIKPFQEMLDDDVLSVRAAFDLSYLRNEEQTMVAQLWPDTQKMSIQQAKKLREASSSEALTQEAAEQILKESQQREKTVAISRKLFTQYFQEDQTQEEIEAVIAKALELYFRQKAD